MCHYYYISSSEVPPLARGEICDLKTHLKGPTRIKKDDIFFASWSLYKGVCVDI